MLKGALQIHQVDYLLQAYFNVWPLETLSVAQTLRVGKKLYQISEIMYNLTFWVDVPLPLGHKEVPAFNTGLLASPSRNLCFYY